jgi:quinol monooxygenase YgiN
MASHSYVVAAEFHTGVGAVEAMKQVVAEVTAPSLDQEGCQIYHWPQGADDPTLFLLYMEWRDKACFEAHIATPHVKHAEDRLKREKCSSSPRKNGTFIDSRVNFTAWQTCDRRAVQAYRYRKRPTCSQHAS